MSGQIKDDTTQLRKDTEHILNKIDQIKETMARQTQIPEDVHGRAHIIERYLNSLASYAESTVGYMATSEQPLPTRSPSLSARIPTLMIPESPYLDVAMAPTRPLEEGTSQAIFEVARRNPKLDESVWKAAIALRGDLAARPVLSMDCATNDWTGLHMTEIRSQREFQRSFGSVIPETRSVLNPEMPIVVLIIGPSLHGKSTLINRFISISVDSDLPTPVYASRYDWIATVHDVKVPLSNYSVFDRDHWSAAVPPIPPNFSIAFRAANTHTSARYMVKPSKPNAELVMIRLVEASSSMFGDDNVENVDAVNKLLSALPGRGLNTVAFVYKHGLPVSGPWQNIMTSMAIACPHLTVINTHYDCINVSAQVSEERPTLYDMTLGAYQDRLVEVGPALPDFGWDFSQYLIDCVPLSDLIFAELVSSNTIASMVWFWTHRSFTPREFDAIKVVKVPSMRAADEMLQRRLDAALLAVKDDVERRKCRVAQARRLICCWTAEGEKLKQEGSHRSEQPVHFDDQPIMLDERSIHVFVPGKASSSNQPSSGVASAATSQQQLSFQHNCYFHVEVVEMCDGGVGTGRPPASLVHLDDWEFNRKDHTWTCIYATHAEQRQTERYTLRSWTERRNLDEAKIKELDMIVESRASDLKSRRARVESAISQEEKVLRVLRDREALARHASDELSEQALSLGHMRLTELERRRYSKPLQDVGDEDVRELLRHVWCRRGGIRDSLSLLSWQWEKEIPNSTTLRDMLEAGER